MISIFKVVIMPHRNCIVSIAQIYRLCRLENARFCKEIMKPDLKQVHMALFGLIFIQDGSHKLWEASGMPPGP